MSKIDEVSKDKNKLIDSWNKIFKTNNPFAYPFQDSIRAVEIFYPTFGYYLTEKQFHALSLAIKELNEEKIAISIIESDGNFFNDNDCEHWICSDFRYEDYTKMPIYLENAIYSLSGTWGIIISHELHAVLGGSISFVQSIKKHYPEASEDLAVLKSEWKDNINNAWLHKFLSELEKRRKN